MNVCKVCGKEIPPTGKRGRPAQTCAECKAKQAVEKAAKKAARAAAKEQAPAAPEQQ